MNDITKICADTDEYATVLLQGSGSYAVEAMIQTFCRDDEKLLIVENGAYGKRMIKQAEMAGKKYTVLSFDMCTAIDPKAVQKKLDEEPDIKTVMLVHSETTSGLINPLKEIAGIAKAAGKDRACRYHVELCRIRDRFESLRHRCTRIKREQMPRGTSGTCVRCCDKKAS